jgi:hypothetical protein
MIRYYVDEDLFILEVSHSRLSAEQQQQQQHERSNRNTGGSPSDPGDGLEPGYDVTLIEMPINSQPSMTSVSPHQTGVVQHHVAAT